MRLTYYHLQNNLQIITYERKWNNTLKALNHLSNKYGVSLIFSEQFSNYVDRLLKHYKESCADNKSMNKFKCVAETIENQIINHLSNHLSTPMKNEFHQLFNDFQEEAQRNIELGGNQDPRELLVISPFKPR